MAHYLRQWLPVWVDIWLEVGQYDLVGELLAVDACIGDPVYGPEPWQQLAAVQHPTGSPPPPPRQRPHPGRRAHGVQGQPSPWPARSAQASLHDRFRPHEPGRGRSQRERGHPRRGPRWTAAVTWWPGGPGRRPPPRTALPPWHMPGLPAAGALRSTGNDLLRYLGAHLQPAGPPRRRPLRSCLEQVEAKPAPALPPWDPDNVFRHQQSIRLPAPRRPAHPLRLRRRHPCAIRVTDQR